MGTQMIKTEYEESIMLLEVFKDVGTKLTGIVDLYDKLEHIPDETKLRVIQQQASRLYYNILNCTK